MGSSSVLRSKTYLDKNEIEEISGNNNYINKIFTESKNEDGYLTIKELNTITNGLINEKILKKIIQICASKKDKLTYDDFCYFYALLTTSSFEAKLNFLLDFIFIKNDKLPKEKYINKVKKYFYGSKLLTDIFLEEKLINNSSNFSRDNIYSFIEKNCKNNLQNYSLYIPDKTFIEMNIEQSDTMLNNGTKENSIESVNIVPIKDQEYESLSVEFKNIEKKHDGIFPISVFEDMLREININNSLVEIIGNYLTKKTQKSFFNFDLFKEILSLLISQETNQNRNNKEVCKGLFKLISYPKNNIDRNTLLKYFKNKKSFDKKFDKLVIDKVIDLSQFLEINKSTNNFFIESLEHIKYLKYIFFNEEIKDHSIELKCLRILIKEESLEDYIFERLQYDTNFYLIDKEFYTKWSESMEKSDEGNYDDFKQLKINTRSISDKNGKLLEGKEYLEDYIIISETLYKLFYRWYGPPLGTNVVRYKIYLDDGIDDIDDNYYRKLKKSKKKPFIGIERKTGRKFELELYPVFLQFFIFSDFIKNSNNSMSKMKSNLRKRLNKEDEGTYAPFSRKTKFTEIVKRYNTNTEESNLRFWVYCNDNLENVVLNNSLEDYEISNKAIVLIEEKFNNIWPSEKIEKDINNKSKDKDDKIFQVGIYNIGNTCYMNSILQIFLNLETIRDIFIHEDDDENKKFLSFILNSENKEINNVVNKKGYLILEFINLLKEKWIEGIKNLTPKKFKEICGEYNSIFKTFEQQDAHDFYTFLVDKLHEETNIKSNSNNPYLEKETPDIIDTNEIDLGNECWANDIRKNASFFYALFMGQLKSILICSECNTQKIKFEPFSALELPIPEGNNIIIEVILFRLPYSLRKFNLEKYNEEDEYLASNNNTNNIEESDRNRKKDKKKKNLKNNNTNRERDKNKYAVINNLLNLNIPLKLKIEVNRKEKCSLIIEKLKCMSDLNIEKNYNFTELIMISKGKYINEDLVIDETFSNLNTVYIYEILNYKGLINIFDYEELENSKILLLKNQEVNNIFIREKTNKILSTVTSNKNNKVNEKKNLNIPSFYFIKKDENNLYEILVPIVHRIKSNLIKTLVPMYSYQYFNDYQDFIILPSSKPIKPYDLYEMMWKKYNYFLNSPSNYENKTWWNYQKKDKKSQPFIITIINRDTSSCAKCPWFRFCTGCTVDPFNSSFIEVNSNNVIAIEWNKDIYNKEIDKNNISLIINHNSVYTITDKSKTDKDKISIDDCLKLFTKKEEIRDIQCEKCQKKTLFMKTYEIERLPRYLVIVLKRFKYNLTNSVKIQNLIQFPLEELPLQNYMSQKNISHKYKLFGVINHSGSIESGHYYSNFNIDDTWLQFDDSHVSEINGGIVSDKVYMLIYQSIKYDKKDRNLNLMGIMERAYKLYNYPEYKFEHIFNYIYDENNNIKHEYLRKCEFYYGEPVTVDGKSGFIVNIIKEDKKKKSNNSIIKIKLSKGFYSIEISASKIIRETLKKRENIDIDTLLNYGKNSSNKKTNKGEGEVVCGGSKVCIIY